MKKQLTNDNIEFVFFYNNRNIRRKMPGDIILAFKTFCDTLPKEEVDKCCLLMHTQPKDENGTDLPEVARVIAPGCKVYFSDKKLEPNQLNWLYNMADVTINIASNEGFGLGTCESLMAGTPIIVNVTGGLQDQCGFKLKRYAPDRTR
jgi:glycosyltransferase involved in cell wall biosynthesis